MKKIIILLMAVVLIIGAALLLKKRKESVKNSTVPTPFTYQIETVSAVTAHLEQTRSFLAKVEAKDSAEIASRLSGQILNLLVTENQTVQQGDLLIQIDSSELEANIKALEAGIAAQEKDVQYAKNLHERNRSLFDVGGLAREKFEASEVMLATKKAVLESSRQKIAALGSQISYLTLTAPFSGVVGTIFSRQGDLAVPGKPLLSINSKGQKLTFRYVAANTAVAPGQEVSVDGRRIGEVSTLYADAENSLSVAEIKLDNQLQQPNKSYLTIELHTFAGEGCRVPLTALFEEKGESRVMTYHNKAFVPMVVSVIADNREYALVDPCPSDPVAVAAAAKLGQLPGLGTVKVTGSGSDE